MKAKITKFLKEQIELIKPSAQDMKILEVKTREVLKILNENIRSKRIKAEVFVGGSFAKNTLIKKNKYDVDLFVRFSSEYDEEEIARLIAKIVPRGSRRVHGSRDYFSILAKLNELECEFEIIPTFKIKNPALAKNITDLSYFHVNYVAGKIKKHAGLANEIRLAKAFLYFQECYGAESYINGFSGYAVELLIIHYKTFVNFLKAVVKSKLGEKIVIDSERAYKNKEQILREMNESKLNSPIILVDPTFRERNAMAALSSETFLRFKKSAERFLSKPSNDFFVLADKKSELTRKYKNNLITIELKTDKQAGDIAGTKLKKFYKFFLFEIARYFDIEKSDFEYDDSRNIGLVYLALKQKKEIIFSGPPVSMKEPLKKFKQQHKHIKVKNGKTYAVEKSVSFPIFLKSFENQKSKTISEMDVDELRVV